MGGWGAINSERALFVLLSKHRDNLPAMDGRFHKTFRQCDVVDDGGTTDIVIWLLLDAARIFWELFEKHAPKEEEES